MWTVKQNNKHIVIRDSDSQALYEILVNPQTFGVTCKDSIGNAAGMCSIPKGGWGKHWALMEVGETQVSRQASPLGGNQTVTATDNGYIIANSWPGTGWFTLTFAAANVFISTLRQNGLQLDLHPAQQQLTPAVDTQSLAEQLFSPRA